MVYSKLGFILTDKPCSSAQLSITFLRQLIQINQVPAFASYLWFFPTNIFPFQAILIILIYLKRNPNSPKAQIGLYTVDGAIEMIESTDSNSWFTPPSEYASDSPGLDRERGPATWRLFKTMRAELGASQGSTMSENLQSRSSRKGPPTSSHGHLAPETSSSRRVSGRKNIYPHPNDGSYALPSGNAVAEQAYFESGLGLDISDLDIWSSIVLQDSEDILLAGAVQ